MELEKFKAQLAKEIARDAIKRRWTHEKQMDLITTLYSQIVDAELELKWLLMDLKVGHSESVRERSDKFSRKYLEINFTIHRNELFLDQRVVSEIRTTYEPLFNLALSYIDTGTVTPEIQKQLPSTMEEIFALGDNPRTKMIEIFRSLAGVE